MFLWNVACDGNKFLEFPLSLFPFIPLAFILKKKKKNKTRQKIQIFCNASSYYMALAGLTI